MLEATTNDAITTVGWFGIIGTCFSVLLATVTFIIFLARIGPAIDRLTEFMREATQQLTDHEQRVSRLEGRFDRRGAGR